jgi:2-succinyl-5-enolpyruvyl-6-hydroxy-3-cyclohexene-1-carboxylate synthase
MKKRGYRIVASPGSRNMPIISAMREVGDITTILDERTAAFYAIGAYDAAPGNIALICTSGSALLNYAPAIAEAYYRRVPLIVISADRPKESLNQNHGQTIDQYGALNNIVCHSISLDDFIGDDTQYAKAAIDITSAFDICNRLQRPIHINIHIAEPLIAYTSADYDIADSAEKVDTIASKDVFKDVFTEPRTMLFAGQLFFNDNIIKAIEYLGDKRGVVTIAEHVANCKTPTAIGQIDALLTEIPVNEQQQILPSRIVCVGGAPMSRKLREFIKKYDIPTTYIGVEKCNVDSFGTLTEQIGMHPHDYLSRLISQKSSLATENTNKAYFNAWHRYAAKAQISTKQFVESAPWSDLKAVSDIISYAKQLNKPYNLQLSNGMAIRYADLNDCRHFLRVSANRGVNGIDGSTSTAIGFADNTKVPTLFITGDLSARYDIGALLNLQIPHRFKMVVINNSGGDIFRCINATRSVDFREQYLTMPGQFDWEAIAKAASLKYFYAENQTWLQSCLDEFFADYSGSALLVIDTQGVDNASVIRHYYERNN